MFDNVSLPVIVIGGGVLLLASFFGMRMLRRIGSPRKASDPAPVLPIFGKQAISERVVHAVRCAEISSEELLDKQEAVVDLEKKQAAVDEVRNATKAIVVKNG